jgi:positive regulator of sigma E activity
MKTSQKWLALAIVALLIAGILSTYLERGEAWAAFGVVMFLGLAVWFLGEVWRYEDRDD